MAAAPLVRRYRMITMAVPVFRAPGGFRLSQNELSAKIGIQPGREENVMADDKKIVGSPDRDRIAMGEEHEVRYWTEALGVSKEQLQTAVDAVGNSADKVRAHLKG